MTVIPNVHLHTYMHACYTPIGLCMGTEMDTHTHTRETPMGTPSRTDAQQLTPAKRRQAISSLKVVIKRLRHSEIF